jgi:hypothetical protein
MIIINKFIDIKTFQNLLVKYCLIYLSRFVSYSNYFKFFLQYNSKLIYIFKPLFVESNKNSSEIPSIKEII